MNHLIKLLNTSLKRIEEGNLDTAKLVIKQVMSELQNTNPNISKEIIKKESFKEYFLNLIKDCIVSERKEEITDDEFYIVKQYTKNNRVFMEYVIDEERFELYQRTMGINSSYLNTNTDIEIYGGTENFHLIVKGILHDYYKLPVNEIQILNF